MGELAGGTIIDTSSTAFARRLANLLIATRERRGISLRALVRSSGGRFTRFDLKAVEAGTKELDDVIIDDLVTLYQADIGAILPQRLPVVVTHGVLTAGGVSTAFAPDDATSLLRSYLLLIRSMRRQKSAPSVDLRREDVESIARYLGESGEAVVMRLGALMGATRTQRTAMASLFASGAVVIGLVGSVAAGAPASDSGRSVVGPSTTISATYVGAPAEALDAAVTVDAEDDAVSGSEVETSDSQDINFIPDDDVPGSGDTGSGDTGSGNDVDPVVTDPADGGSDDAGAPVSGSAGSGSAGSGSTGSGSGVDPVVEPVVDPAADSGLDLDLLTYTGIADPITFVLEPVIIDVGEPPAPTTTIDVAVDTGLPPVPAG